MLSKERSDAHPCHVERSGRSECPPRVMLSGMNEVSGVETSAQTHIRFFRMREVMHTLVMLSGTDEVSGVETSDQTHIRFV